MSIDGQRDILILTTVHASDDTRIRERLIRTLAPLGSVHLASRWPGPTDRNGLTWTELPGGRLRRNLGALLLLMKQRFDIAVLHDPEIILAGLLTRWFRRSIVVFDVHEDLPAQIAVKEWIPSWAKPWFRLLSLGLYRLADRFLVLTLAEPSYQHLFRNDHVVFRNYPLSSRFPVPRTMGDGGAVYVGDVTRARGIEEAVEACRRVGVHLVVVGPVDDAFKRSFEERAATVSFLGRLPNPAAMDVAVAASVGLSPLRDEANYRSSLPTKTLEYLALGLPVVATDLPGTREILQDLECVWLVAPGEVEAMSTAIVAAVSLGSKARAAEQAEAVRKQFSWPADEVLAFYASLLEARR
jgi:glycosyltransferase involved in cell wall biosynthesis